MTAPIRKAFAFFLALLMLFTAGCSNSVQPATAAVSPVAAPAYPEMSPYPDESQFIKPNGDFDSEGFDKVYTAWREDLDRQRTQPQGYTQGLPEFFAESIPHFLAGDAANPVCSPLNLYMALAMLAESTDTATRQEILDALNAESITALRAQAGQVWNAHYCADGATATVLANSLWLRQDLAYNEATVNTLARDYYASVFQGALGSEEMDQALQQWLNAQTGGLLQEQIQNVTMDPQTVLALASTIYYRAKWRNEFQEERNTQGVFHAASGDRDVTFLNTVQTYGPYYWGEDFAAVSLHLEDGSRMWLVLPDEGRTPADLLSGGLALDMILNRPDTYENQKSIRVNLSMPKFDITADTRIEQPLRDLGITRVFDPDRADFSSVLPDTPAWLDQVQHAARVTVDEEGVAAAAYTVMMTAGAAMPPEDEVDFIADRPFLFFITSRDNLPLFAGIVNEP